jgi:glycosyltransferase involved in cell wall biosynthesis
MCEGLVKKYRDKILCYDLCEDYAAKYAVGSDWYKIVKESDKYLSERADIIFAATKPLLDAKRRVNKNTFFVTNGVNIEIFDRLKGCTIKIIPEDVRNIPRPIIMNVGILNDRTDIDAINEIAKKKKNWSVVHIGPRHSNAPEVGRLSLNKNVYFLGPKPAKDIPIYLTHADICMLAYKSNYQNTAGSSMKLFLYLASGKPIISFSAGGADDFRAVLNMVDSPGEFIAIMDDVLKNDTHDLAEKRRVIAGQNSWQKKGEYIHSVIVNKIKDMLPAVWCA